MAIMGWRNHKVTVTSMAPVAFRSSSVILLLLFQQSRGLRHFHFAATHQRGLPHPTSSSSSLLTLRSSASSLQRLERIVANRGVGSRNDVAKLFKAGRVSINGQVIKSGADKYPIDVTVEIDGVLVTEIPLLAVYYKPLGVHSTMRDNWNRASLEELSLEYPFLKTMHPVGRLDADTTGLLLFSSDGQLTQTLLHPSTGIEREYEAVVAGKVEPTVLGPKLAGGITTTEGTFVADLLSTVLLDEMVAVPVDERFDDEESDDDEDDGEEIDITSSTTDSHPQQGKEVDKDQVNLVPASRVRVSVREGKYRMVRRILHNAGHSVLELHRVRYGSILLTDDVGEGEVRPCTAEEKKWAEQVMKSSNSKAKNALRKEAPSGKKPSERGDGTVGSRSRSKSDE